MDHLTDIADCAPDVQNEPLRSLQLYVDELLSRILCN